MITGEQLREARTRARLTQEELATAVGTTLRSVGNWERGSGVPKAKEARVRAALAQHLGGDPGNPLASASDMALLAELGRRLARAAEDEREAHGVQPGKKSDGDDGGEVIELRPDYGSMAADDSPREDDLDED